MRKRKGEIRNKRIERKLTHVDEAGHARMVNVSAKPETLRYAMARAEIILPRPVYRVLTAGSVSKGDALAVARTAGIAAVKAAPGLITLAHPLRISFAAIDFSFTRKTATVNIDCRVKAIDRTGVEMEAMTGAAVAALNLYDMLKGMDKGIRITNLRLLSKSGGRSGEYHGT